jgi:hypothetical protein
MRKNERRATPSSKVPTGSLTAKGILRKAFACADSLTDDKVLQQISDVLGSGAATHVNSLGAAATLMSTVGGEFLKRLWSDLQSLSVTDREDVELAILSKLKQSAKVRPGGRPKGAKGQGTEQQIYLAAALQFLGCSATAIVSFLNPTQHRKKARKQAVYRFLKRHAVSIKQEYASMNEELAFKMVRANVTIELAKRIVNQDF